MPNPVQVNQPVLFHVGSQYPTSRPQLGLYNLEVEVTDPDGTVTILTATMTDTTGGTGVQYTPTKVGTYTVRTHFPEQVKEFRDNYTGSAGTIMQDAYSEPIELVVQTEPTGYARAQSFEHRARASANPHILHRINDYTIKGD